MTTLVIDVNVVTGTPGD